MPFVRNLLITGFVGTCLAASACDAETPEGGVTGGTANGSGGVLNTGGAATSGGIATTGGTVTMSGGRPTGGTASGGVPTGGNASGGSATGGNATGGTSCTTPPAQDPIIGWATVSGNGVTTTTGGGTATPTVVTSLSQLTSLVSGTTAAVIHVNGVLSGTANLKIGSNKTIIGVCGAQVTGHLGLSGSSNVIIRNLKIVGNNCSDVSTAGDCSTGSDAVTVNNGSHHLWFDHCDISDGSDGNLDITQGSDFVTVSWTKFSYSSRRTDTANGASGHRFSNLIGAGDTVTTDAGKLNVTWHHNWWADNVDQRMPRTRYGKIHVFNNLFTATGNSYCTNAGIQASVLVENNVYIGVKNPLSPDANGDMLARNNVYTNCTGTMAANGVGFTPPYTYTGQATGALESAIRTGAGPR